MTLQAEDIRVMGNGGVYLADVGTAFPLWADDLADDADFLDLGYVTTDGFTMSFGRETTDIFAFQSNEPVRTVETRQPKTVAFSAMQTGREQIELALGGGSWTVVGAAPNEVYTFTPPASGFVNEKAMIIELIDGTLKYRYKYPRVLNKGTVEIKAVRADAFAFPITMSVLQPASGAAPFTLETNDDAVAAAA